MTSVFTGNESAWYESMPGAFSITRYENEKEWNKERLRHISASEAADVIGVGFSDNVSLWERKCGIKEAAEFSEATKQLMQRGSDAEAHIRELFAIDNGIDNMHDGTLTLITSRANPFMTCTLDAWYGSKQGATILEVKRSESSKTFGDGLPMKYRAQLIHQMYVTGIKHAVLCAYIRTAYSRTNDALVRTFRLEADDDDVMYDMEKLVEAEIVFWDNVKRKERPAKIIPWI